MSTFLIQNGINSPSAKILLKCLLGDELATLQAWLGARKISFAQSLEEVTSVGFWCVAGDPKNTFFTLTQALDFEGKLFFNDTAWLFYCPDTA